MFLETKIQSLQDYLSSVGKGPCVYVQRMFEMRRCSYMGGIVAQNIAKKSTETWWPHLRPTIDNSAICCQFLLI